MTETDEKIAEHDREIADLKRRMQRVEGELGIVSIDQAGVPDRGEIQRPKRAN